MEWESVVLQSQMTMITQYLNMIPALDKCGRGKKMAIIFRQLRMLDKIKVRKYPKFLDYHLVICFLA